MAYRKDQSLSEGVFYPPYDQLTIFKCRTQNTWGFIKEIGLYTVLIGFFAFLLTEWLALLIVPISWPFLINFMLPKHYAYISISKHSISFGKGSLKSLILERSLFSSNKKLYNEIHHIRFNRWEKKKRGAKKDYFGKIELKHDQLQSIFYFLTTGEDLIKLVKIFDTYRFNVKVNKIRSRGELMLIFQKSSRFG
ncbi:MAG: hypothetical protein ACXABI_12545 [Candidatus Hodarchaeales archaeon]|jgi:hypothetical protein